ncbi:hypothetical protein EV702DRAFT_1146166 [Suillus placidus]|uniref:Serine/threonine-protein phosphatase 1 regulatory subunit 10 n=1 Tax=Suillus placidus TaxID=48579 RepID=A0A9P6ZKJ2_9AGAM|nr:hypothetical protein EV702DRAFT_1146166 [Suillus placidus]
MDLYSNAQNWTQNLTGGTPSTDDWKEQSSPTNGAGVPPGTTAQQPSLDLSDYTIGDLAGPSTSSSISPPPAYYGGPFNPFYLSSVPGPYNAVPYGSMSWTNPQTHLPLSNYSTLNGATSATSSQQSASQHQSPPAQNQQPMMIDPALTTMNGSGSEPPRQYTQSPTHVAQSTSQSQPRHPYQYQHPTLSINPAYVLPPHFYSSHLTQHQPTSQSQGTLSPHVLHSPTSTMMGQLSSFYAQSPSTPSTSTVTTATSTTAAPAQPPTINIQARKDSFVTDVRPLLQPNAFGGARAIHNLVNLIDDFGSEEVEPSLRMEILTKIRDNAGNHYFRAWSENNTAMDITREWLKAAATAKSDTPLVDTVMPLLHIIDRLPLSVESLKSSKLGKIIVKLVKEPPAPAIKDMASNLERRWRQLVETAQKQAENTQTEDSKFKKRKPVEQPSAKAPPPAKKAAVAPTASASKPMAVKKETRPIIAVKDARSDSSFFSAPKPKAKLPSFKKAPAPVKREPDLNVAQPSSIDPFQEALKSMGKGRRDSPVTSTPPPASMSITPPLMTSGRTKRKSVTWAPDGQLESIRLIERAVYDDDPVDGVHTTHSLRDLDRGEGAALHAPLFEEVIDWTDPITLEFDLETSQRGQNSAEKTTQEEREQTALGALYMSPAQIPDSPGEPTTIIGDDEIDVDVKAMTAGSECDNFFWREADLPQPNAASVADLVGQLSGSFDSMSAPSGAGIQSFGFDPALLSQLPIAPEQVQELMQQAQALFNQHPSGAGVQAQFGGTDQNWNPNAATGDYGRGYADNGNARGRWTSDRGQFRGRGRGRGRGEDGSYRSSKRKPCSFFAEGRCRYGDQCDFSHEPIYS